MQHALLGGVTKLSHTSDTCAKLLKSTSHGQLRFQRTSSRTELEQCTAVGGARRYEEIILVRTHTHTHTQTRKYWLADITERALIHLRAAWLAAAAAAAAAAGECVTIRAVMLGTDDTRLRW